MNSKHLQDFDPGLSFGYSFSLFVVGLQLLRLIISLGQRLGAGTVADLSFIVLFNISLESIRVYQYLICLRLIMILFNLHLNHLVFWCFFFGLSMVLNLFDDLARLRYTLRNLVRPFQVFFIQIVPESWGPQ